MLGTWTVNGLYELQVPPGLAPKRAANGLGHIYIQVKFIDNPADDKEPQAPPVTDDIETQLKLDQERIEGTLKVVVAHGLKLLPVDNDSTTSDPYVQISYNGKTYKSKHINKTLNPIWNFKQDIPFSVLKKDPPKLSIHVFDHNAILSNNLIGLKEFKLDEVFANPGLIFSF
jgi:Ca2+-dependent lipid-binding protein, contains C2 domain